MVRRYDILEPVDPGADYGTAVPYEWKPLRAVRLQGFLLRVYCWFTRSFLWRFIYKLFAEKSGIPQVRLPIFVLRQRFSCEQRNKAPRDVTQYVFRGCRCQFNSLCRSNVLFLKYSGQGPVQALQRTSVPDIPIYQPPADPRYSDADAALCQKITGKKPVAVPGGRDRTSAFLECFACTTLPESAPGPTVQEYHDAYKQACHAADLQETDTLPLRMLTNASGGGAAQSCVISGRMFVLPPHLCVQRRI